MNTNASKVALLAWVLLSNAIFCQNACKEIRSEIPDPLLNAKLETSLISNTDAQSELNCLQRCFRMPNCFGVNVKSKNSVICELLSKQQGRWSGKLQVNKNWKHYSLDFRSICNAKNANYLCPAKKRLICSSSQPQVYSCKDLQNIAYQKQTHQSSTYSASSSSNKANDGNKNMHVPGLCSRTNADSIPWWLVNFGKTAKIWSVAITSKGIPSFIVYAMKAESTTKIYCGSSFSMPKPGTKLFRCQKVISGEYLRVENQRSESLELCEVEVFGEISKVHLTN